MSVQAGSPRDIPHSSDGLQTEHCILTRDLSLQSKLPKSRNNGCLWNTTATQNTEHFHQVIIREPSTKPLDALKSLEKDVWRDATMDFVLSLALCGGPSQMCVCASTCAHAFIADVTELQRLSTPPSHSHPRMESDLLGGQLWTHIHLEMSPPP